MNSELVWQKIRKDVIGKIGGHAYKKLHKSNIFLDFSVFGFLYAIFLIFIYMLANVKFGILWSMIFIGQGFLIQAILICAHDMFVHRKVGGHKISYVLSYPSFFLAFIWPTIYKESHFSHHLYTNTQRDPEIDDKIYLDTRWKKLLSTFVLAYTFPLLRFFEIGLANYPLYQELKRKKPSAMRKFKLERNLLKIYTIVIILACYFWPKYFLFGYIFPLFMVGSIANIFRVILEHAENNYPENLLHATTYYKTGVISRLLFLYDAGDCHLVHHLFPSIPFYNIGSAITLLRPYFLENGVVERTSFFQIIYGYFVKDFKHRSFWGKNI